ncbi:serine/threonine-protein kinase-like protein At3g51990 [Apium graveolens]|uniref:serine/threonine-protein kinase-like protein At3g51990 n=1 Tax=Apium graveolens TaxID=4045 RepID=UPI003D7968EE
MGYLSCKSQSSISISNPQPKFPKIKNQENPPIKVQEFSYTDLELATNNFSPQKLLGRGSHGLVYKAILKNGVQVAVKRPSRGTTTTTQSRSKLSSSSSFTHSKHIVNEVENEIEILSQIHSPRLVNLLGFTNDSKDRLLVVEFMSNGTLYDYLHSNVRPPNWGKRIRLALQTAKALETLHCSNPPVIHRDIKSANVLIDNNVNARLGDFGLALRCHVDDIYRLRSTPPAGTMGYLDPGYVTPDNLSTKSDVFSFGILLLEIISGRKAIDVGYSPPSIVDWAIPLIRKEKLLGVFDPRIEPPRDPLVRRQLTVIAAKCVRNCRDRRPTMSEVVECLSRLSKLVPLHSWNGFGNPCLMVENVGFPVRSSPSNASLKNGEEERLDGLDAVFGRSLRHPRRVYSDMGFRNNLMDLMAGTDRLSGSQRENDGFEPKPKTKVLSFRSESGRVVGKRSNKSHANEDDRESVFDLMKIQSFRETATDMHYRVHDRIAGSSRFQG